MLRINICGSERHDKSDNHFQSAQFNVGFEEEEILFEDGLRYESN